MTRRPIDSRVSALAPEEERRADELRAAYANWASGVAVVTARDDDGHVYGMTVAALTPVSVDPPIVLFCIHNDAPLASVLQPALGCAVSILSEGQKRAATTFADRFTVPGDLITDDDVPVIVDASATLVGRVREVHDGGDHRIVLMDVVEARTVGDLPPLVYWAREYRMLAGDR